MNSSRQRGAPRGGSVASTQTRHEDVIVQRRFGKDSSTGAVKQLYGVTYPGHTDRGTEHESYSEAEETALAIGRDHGVSVWYEETPQSGRRTLIGSFRGSA